MKIVLCLLSLLFCSLVNAKPVTNTGPTKFEWKEKAASYFMGKAEIKVLDPIIGSGQSPVLEVRFINSSEDKQRALFSSTVFYGAFFQHTGSALPAALAVFDENRKFVMNLFEWTGGARADITTEAWSTIPAGAYVGTYLTLPLLVGRPRGPARPKRTYYLQLIYNESFIAPRPRSEEELIAFRVHGKWNELFRSNVIKIEVNGRNGF